MLSEIVTSADLEADPPVKKSCGGCSACLRCCPTGALVAPGVLDNQKCISFWTIEHQGVIPIAMRPLLGDWIFGCDLCQEVCPVNSLGAREPRNRVAIEAFGPLMNHRPALAALLALDEPAFAERFRSTAVWRPRRAGLLRNVCIALGNTADRTSVPALAKALADDEPLIRGHAAWALGRLGGRLARAALDEALRREGDDWVREECELALEACAARGLSSAV